MKSKTEENYLKKELYELVKTNESIFDFIQEGSLDGLWYWDLENPENEWMNPKFWIVLGYDPDEMPHRSSAWQNIINQDDLKLALKNFELHCENPNHPYDQIVRYTHKDGSTVWIRCRGIAIRDNNGKPIRMLGAHQNITSQKKSEEEALKKSNVLQNINKYALEISALSYNDLIPQIGKKIKRLFGIKEVAITEYNEKDKVLITRFTTLSNEENSNISKFLGERIIGLKTPVTDDTYKKITSSIVSKVDSFHDLTFGKIPETVSKMIKRMYGLEWFIGIALMQDEKLHGTMILAGSIEQDVPDKEILMTFIKITTTELSRRKAEELLKESELKFRAFVENANDVIYQLSPEGTIIYISPNWTEMLGYKIDETIGENIEKFVHPDDLYLCIDFLNKVLSTGEKQSGAEYRVKHINGEFRWHNSNVSPIKNENGNITSFIGVGRDITEQRIFLENLHKREVLFNSVLTTIPDLVSIHDKDLNIIFSNWNGFGAVELEKRKLYSKCYNTYRNYDSICPDCEAKKVLETKNVHQSQITLPDGKSYDIRVFPILDPAGVNDTFVEWVRDISDIKETERILRDKNEEYEALNEELLQANEEYISAKERAEESKANVTAIIEGTQSSIWAFNRNYEILYINNVFRRDFEQSFGVTLEKGTSLIDSLPEVLRPIWKPRYDRVLANEQFSIEDAVETEIGTLYIQVTFNPIIKNGQVIGGSCFGTNITEQKQIEIEIIKAKEKAEENEERFNLAMKASHDGLFDWNLETNEIYYSPGWKKMLGYDEHELPNDFSVWEKTTDKEDVKRSWDLQQKLISKEIDRFVIEFKMKHKDGHWVDILARAEALFDEKGKAVRIVGTHTDISERKKAEENLRLSEEKYRTLVNSTLQGVVIAQDNPIRLVFANPAMEEISGFSLDSLIEMGPVELANLIYEEDRIRFFSNFQKRIKGDNIPSENEYRFKTRDGLSKWVSIHSSLIEYQNKPATLTTFIDITERKLAEILLAQERQRLASIIEGTNVGTWEWNIRTGETVFNEKWAEIIGYSLEELKPISINTWMKFAHPDDLVKSNELLEKHFKGELDYYDCESRMKHKNGNWIWILDRGKVYEWDEDGNPIKMSGTHQDITDRKRYEILLQEKNEEIEAQNEEYMQINEELIQTNNELFKAKESIEESKIRLELAIEAGEHGFWDWKLETNETYFSPSYYTMLGYKNKELPMNLNTFMMLLHSNDALIVMPIVQQSIESGKPYQVEFRLKCKDGSYKWILGKGKSYRSDDSGKTNRAVGVHIDIHERKMMMDDLQTAKEKAEESGRLKSAFLANMSHEIRTPMNGILGFANLLKEPNLSGDEQQEFISIIEKSGERMLNIINNIVDISKIEAGLMEVNITNTNINDQSEYVYNFFKPEAEAKGLSFFLKKALPSEETSVKTDSEKVYAILTNLVKNAIKYCEHGAIEFGYTITNEYDRSFLQFYVKDTGIGIPEDKLDAIFERFIQTHISDKMARQGAGLGLAITKAYVEMLGGKIWVESKEGDGSTFYFTLPYNTEAV
jgi:PAS domain S-box-containing protein